jgi:hypothetical protein
MKNYVYLCLLILIAINSTLINSTSTNNLDINNSKQKLKRSIDYLLNDYNK